MNVVSNLSAVGPRAFLRIGCIHLQAGASGTETSEQGPFTRAEISRRFRRRHPDYDRRWRLLNPKRGYYLQKARDYANRWRLDHPELHSAEVSRYQKRNREKVREWQRRYRLRHADRVKEKASARRRSLALSYGYVRSRLRIWRISIPPELISIKRCQIQLVRAIREQNKQQTNKP